MTGALTPKDRGTVKTVRGLLISPNLGTFSCFADDPQTSLHNA